MEKDGSKWAVVDYCFHIVQFGEVKNSAGMDLHRLSHHLRHASDTKNVGSLPLYLHTTNIGEAIVWRDSVISYIR